MSIHSFARRKFLAVAALIAASVGTVVITGNNPVHAVSGTGGLISMGNGGQCTASAAIDANSANWNWAKPTLEYSTDGTTFTSAAGTNYGLKLCRDVASSAGGMVQAYWFIVMRADGNDDMVGMPGIENTTFRVNIPLKTGDNTTRLTGYSEVVSLSESNGVATVLTKASGLAKVNWQGLTSFLTAHPECAGSTEQTWSQCKINKADRDIQYMVIQHLEYSTSALTTFQQVLKGTWIGANVSGYNMNLNCGSVGSDSNSGGNYNGANDSGANASTTRSLEVSVSGTPHLRADGVTINTGKLTAFIPGEVASKCFGDGTAASTLEVIAKALTMTRTESSENGGAAQSLTSGTTFTAEAVNTPVAGIMIKVPTMTFSNPTYKVSSTLASSSTSTSSGSKTMTKGKKSSLTSLIKPTSGAKLKWSVSGGCKISGSKVVAPNKAATCKLTLKQTVTKTVSGKKKTTTTTKSVTIKVS